MILFPSFYLHGKLVHPVTGEHGVRVAVDEARHHAHSGAVEDLAKVVVAAGVLSGDLVGLTNVLYDPTVMVDQEKRRELLLRGILDTSCLFQFRNMTRYFQRGPKRRFYVTLL